MAKNKPLKDEEYDSIDEIQTTLDRHTDKLNRIEAGLVSIKSEIASVSKTGGHNMDSSGDRQFIQLRNLFYDILDKLSKAYEELKTGKSDAQTEELLVKIANLCTDIQKNSLNAVALTADTNKQYLKIIPYIERMNRILDVVAERYNMSKAPVKPTTIKGWILWAFKRLWSWIDRYVGFRYIKQFCVLVAIFIWVVSIVTSFFILRENHRLNETKRKYILLRKECFKHKETMGFVNYVDHAIDK